MDDKQTPQNLHGNEAAAKIHELGGKIRTCMFGSRHEPHGMEFRPMGVQNVDENGVFWFLSQKDSDKNQDVERDAQVILTFQDDSAMKYMSLTGRATVHTDRATIDQHWSAMAKNWFEGPEDPSVSVIRVEPVDGHYWESQGGRIVALARMAFGAMTDGVNSDVGVDGSLKP